MFVFPLSTVSEVARSNVEMQLSIFLSLSKGMLDTSSTLGRLNTQSGIKLLNDLKAVFSDPLLIRTGRPAQDAILEQTRNSMAATQASQVSAPGVSLRKKSIDSQGVEADEPEQSPVTAQEDNEQSGSHAELRHAHETDPKPSQLVEKLVASVASDTDILDK